MLNCLATEQQIILDEGTLIGNEGQIAADWEGLGLRHERTAGLRRKLVNGNQGKLRLDGSTESANYCLREPLWG